MPALVAGLLMLSAAAAVNGAPCSVQIWKMVGYPCAVLYYLDIICN